MSDNTEEREALEGEYRTSSLRQMGESRGVSWQAMQQKLNRLGIVLRGKGGDTRPFARVTYE